jgi:hypothetical protein
MEIVYDIDVLDFQVEDVAHRTHFRVTVDCRP